MELTEASIARLHEELGVPTSAKTVEKLVLARKGVAKIQNLGAYFNCRAVLLGQNAIRRIEGFERMRQLRVLHLEGNCIQRIEGLEEQTQLVELNLASNQIQRVENVGHLKLLQRINLSSNAIQSLEDLQELRNLPKLITADVSTNHLSKEDGEKLVEFWVSTTPQLRTLYLFGNEVVRFVSDYRRRLLCALPELTYLDKQPVGPRDRACALAWQEGGAAAERAKRAELTRLDQRPFSADPEWEDRKKVLAERQAKTLARIDQEEAKVAADRQARLDRIGSIGEADELQASLSEYSARWHRELEEGGPEAVHRLAAAGGPGMRAAPKRPQPLSRRAEPAPREPREASLREEPQNELLELD